MLMNSRDGCPIGGLYVDEFLNESILISLLCNMKNMSFVPCEYIENVK